MIITSWSYYLCKYSTGEPYIQRTDGRTVQNWWRGRWFKSNITPNQLKNSFLDSKEVDILTAREYMGYPDIDKIR